MKLTKAEYIWIDGAKPTAALRSKTRILPFIASPTLNAFPEWGYDGSSTYQASGDASDLILKPVFCTPDPLRGSGHYLVLCEVYVDHNTPHPSNTRASLRAVIDKVAECEPWIGFEQEYTFFQNGAPLGWPQSGYPAPQGPYYCGVGAKAVFGREIVERHTDACLDAHLCIYGINAEVMPGQWEFQIGYRGIDEESVDPIAISDQLWMARWLLKRIAEEYNVVVSFAAKPVKGDWNGAGMHTNFSLKEMREQNGLVCIEKAIGLLEKHCQKSIQAYGDGIEERLTGLHETCHYSEFRSGVSDRGASIRIPLHVQQKRCGYFEDRRPNANADPYRVASSLLRIVCDL